MLEWDLKVIPILYEYFIVEIFGKYDSVSLSTLNINWIQNERGHKKVDKIKSENEKGVTHLFIQKLLFKEVI